MADDVMKDLENDPGHEEPAPEPKEEPATSDIDALIAELQKIGVEKPEQLSNMATASQQAGRAFQMVGELRKANEELRALLNQHQQKPKSEYNEYGEAQPVDLEQMMRKTLRQFYQEDIIRPQQEAAQRYYEEIEAIYSDEDYAAVKDAWEAYKATPNVAIGLQNGNLSAKNEYDKLVKKYYRQLVKRSHDTLRSLKPTSKPPHIEGSESRSVQMPKESDDKDEKIKRAHENRQKGSMSSDAALEAIVKASLGMDDPIWRT